MTNHKFTNHTLSLSQVSLQLSTKLYTCWQTLLYQPDQIILEKIRSRIIQLHLERQHMFLRPRPRTFSSGTSVLISVDCVNKGLFDLPLLSTYISQRTHNTLQTEFIQERLSVVEQQVPSSKHSTAMYVTMSAQWPMYTTQSITSYDLHANVRYETVSGLMI